MTDVCILKVQITVAKVKTEGAPHKNEVRIRKKRKKNSRRHGLGKLHGGNEETKTGEEAAHSSTAAHR